MIFDPDHMSVKARNSALDTIDRLGYHGVALEPLVGDAGRLPADLRGGRLHHAVRRRLDRLRREVAPPRRLGRPALLLRHRLRRRHERPRRPGQPARRRRRQPGDLPVQGAQRRHGSASRPPGSAPGTSTSTASRSTASTPTGSRTSPRSPARDGDAITDDMSPRPRGLPADVGARRGHPPRLVPQPGAAPAVAKVEQADPPGDDAPAR